MVNKWKNKTHLGPEGEGKHNLLIPEFKSAASPKHNIKLEGVKQTRTRKTRRLMTDMGHDQILHVKTTQRQSEPRR